MHSQQPRITVVIPTHNRVDSLKRTLEALSNQTLECSQFEVHVCADNCSDDTENFLQTLRMPYQLIVHAQTFNGPAAGRNAGAFAAKGEILVFLDDDIESEPKMLEAHLESHAKHPRAVVMGYSIPAIGATKSYFHIELRRWWENTFFEMGKPAYRFSFMDLLTGNMSIRREVFTELNGFDEAFSGHVREDYELGARLIKAGVAFCFNRAAAGKHYDESDLARTFRRAFREGKGDVLILRRHPELYHAMPMSRAMKSHSWLTRLLRRALRSDLFLANMLASLARGRLRWFEFSHQRNAWQMLHRSLREYWYWRGVFEMLDGSSGTESFVESLVQQSESPKASVDVDLTDKDGLAQVLENLEAKCSINCYLGSEFVGEIPGREGFEALTPAKLLRELFEYYRWEYLLAYTANAAMQMPANGTLSQEESAAILEAAV